MLNVKWKQVDEFIEYTCERIDVLGKSFTGVYGMPRGGLTLAVMVSHALGIPMLMAPCKNCLIIDDIVDSGAALQKKHSEGYFIASMFYSEETASFEPDIWMFQKRGEWVVFPWEYKRKAELASAESDQKEAITVQEDWQTEILYDDPALGCCAASALASFFKGDASAFSNWLLNLAHRVYWPGAWDENICYSALNCNYTEFVQLLASCVYWNIEQEGSGKSACKAYIDVVTQIALIISGKNASVSETPSEISAKYTSDEVYKACLALRYYFLALYHEDKNSLRNPKFDWDEFNSLCNKLNLSWCKTSRDKAVQCFMLLNDFVASKIM